MRLRLQPRTCEHREHNEYRGPVEGYRDPVERWAWSNHRRCVSGRRFGGAHLVAPVRGKCTNWVSPCIFKSDISLLRIRKIVAVRRRCHFRGGPVEPALVPGIIDARNMT